MFAFSNTVCGAIKIENTLLARRCYLDANDVLLLKVMMMYRSTTQSEMGSREHLLLLSLPATD